MTDRQTAAAVLVLLLAAAGGLAIGAPAVGPGEVAPIGAGEVGPTATAAPVLSTAGNLTIWFCDVGQGDAALIRTPAGRAWLIDTGPPDSADHLIAEIHGFGVTYIHAITITHGHMDHYGGLEELKGALRTGTTTPARLDPNLTVQLIPHDRPSVDANDRSRVYRVTFRNASILLTGDATATAEAEMVEEGAARIRADVLKVGHHGSADASSAEFLEAVDPALAVISVGAGNDYGHPSPYTISRLTKIGATVDRTDRDGWIMATTDGAAWTVRTEHGGYWSFIAGA